MGKNRHDRHGDTAVKSWTTRRHTRLNVRRTEFLNSYHVTRVFKFLSCDKHFLSCDIATQASNLGPMYTPLLGPSKTPISCFSNLKMHVFKTFQIQLMEYLDINFMSRGHRQTSFTDMNLFGVITGH